MKLTAVIPRLRMASAMGANHLRYFLATAGTVCGEYGPNPEYADKEEQLYNNVADFNSGVYKIAREFLPEDEINDYLRKHCKIVEM